MFGHVVMKILTVDQNSNKRMDEQMNKQTEAPFNIDRIHHTTYLHHLNYNAMYYRVQVESIKTVSILNLSTIQVNNWLGVNQNSLGDQNKCGWPSK